MPLLRTGTVAAVDHVGGVPVGLAGLLREAVVSIGPDGLVEWANAAALELLRLDADDLVGTDALARLHPDEVARAIDGITFSTNHPDRTAVVPFRLRAGDDTWVDVELMSSMVRADGGDHLVLVLRDASPRRAVGQALATVAAGGTIDETAHWLARVVETRWPSTIAAVLLVDRHGRRLLAAESWTGDLRAAVVETEADVALWRSAVASGEVVVCPQEKLPLQARAAAEAQGFTTFATAPVFDPGGGSAAIVAWFDLPDAAHMEFAHASLELRELLGLALERRHHLSRLDHAARHDGLTGLLNRSGFVELAGKWADAPSDGLRAALLYLDLDGFKPVNDRFGHAVGDAVLRVVAGRLSALAQGWAVARIGGDEFVLFGSGHDAIGGEANALAEAAVAAVGEPIEVASGDGELVGVSIGASVGVAVAAADGDLDGLLELADGAMYAVKRAGGSSWRAQARG